MDTLYRLDRTLIRVSGPDTLGFLNNLITQELDGFSATNGVRYGALLSPQGKVIADMLLWSQPDGVTIETDPTRAAELTRRLAMYQLRAHVEIVDVTASIMVTWSERAFEHGIADPRLAALGWRRLSARGDAASGDNVFDAHRLALGVPDLARDASPDEVFAGEALLEELHGVDFQKGCFVGQENVSRMKRRATTRKKFCPIVFEGDAPAFGTPIRAGDAEIGTVRTGSTGRAMALLRLDRALEAADTLSADGRAIRLDPPPWLILPGNAPA